jgi:hypothetical protein
MASLIQFERRGAPAELPLTPELRQFIERVVVPILVQEYLSEPNGEKPIAESSSSVASCDMQTNTSQAEVA